MLCNGGSCSFTRSLCLLCRLVQVPNQTTTELSQVVSNCIHSTPRTLLRLSKKPSLRTRLPGEAASLGIGRGEKRRLSAHPTFSPRREAKLASKAPGSVSGRRGEGRADSPFAATRLPQPPPPPPPPRARKSAAVPFQATGIAAPSLSRSFTPRIRSLAGSQAGALADLSPVSPSRVKFASTLDRPPAPPRAVGSEVPSSPDCGWGCISQNSWK
ncbi:serine/arginine repetitive matrix protein 1-like [Anolis carolinensis]|uniref:serine/arginine repetitive matrix protein 1-like n=1 Tax=Anolis carolinensis TaxID=28377 RepID=UPI002F2B7B12